MMLKVSPTIHSLLPDSKQNLTKNIDHVDPLLATKTFNSVFGTFLNFCNSKLIWNVYCSE